MSEPRPRFSASLAKDAVYKTLTEELRHGREQKRDQKGGSLHAGDGTMG